MRHPKTSFAISALYLSVFGFFVILCLFAGAYFLALIPLIPFSYECYRVYRKVQLYSNGPLTEEQKQLKRSMHRQMDDYRRNNLYDKWYRFADASEQEYIAERIHQTAKRLRRK